MSIGKPEVSQDSEAFKTRPFVDGAKTLIGGQVKPWAGIFSEIFSPIYCQETGDRICIGRQATMSPKEAMEAVQAASKAWDLGRGEWPQRTLQQRIAAVGKLVSKLKEKRLEIAKVLQWEICKNDADSVKEFDRTMDFVSALIDTARKLNSGGAICQEGIHAILKRSPMGVMMNLGPSNYPFNETYCVPHVAAFRCTFLCSVIAEETEFAPFVFFCTYFLRIQRMPSVSVPCF